MSKDSPSTETNFFTDTRKELEQYVADRLLLFKMQSTDKGSKLIASLFFILLDAMLFFFILLFLSIMAGYFFAEVTGSLYVGFGIVAGTYLLLGLLLFLMRGRIEKKIIDTIIQIIFDKTEGDDDENES